MNYLKKSLFHIILSSVLFLLFIFLFNNKLNLLPIGSSNNFDFIQSNYLIFIYLMILILIRSFYLIKKQPSIDSVSTFIKIIAQAFLWIFFFTWIPITSLYWLFKKRAFSIEEQLIKI